MPPTYCQAFFEADSAEHARLAALATRDVQVGGWQVLKGGLTLLAVVAPDRAGLIALISAALLAHRLDLRSAQIYSRQTATGVQAVDLFWVRAVDETLQQVPIDDARKAAFAATLREFCGAELRTDTSDNLSPTLAAAAVHVELRREPPRIEVRAPDGIGLLGRIARCLYASGLEVSSATVTTEDGTAVDVFELASLPSGFDEQAERALCDALERAVRRNSRTS